MKTYFAAALFNDEIVIKSFSDRDSAIFGKEMLKSSGAKKVAVSRRKATKEQAEKALAHWGNLPFNHVNQGKE